MGGKKPSENVSIVIPAYNEESTISGVLRDVKKVTKDIKNRSFEILVVDNNSTDNTAVIARKNGARVLTERKRGKGNALVCGFKTSKYPLILMLDADGSHVASDIPVLLAKLREGHGLVIGSRIKGGSDEYTPTRAIGNVILTSISNIFFNTSLSDAINGYKVFRKDIVKNTKFHSNDFEIEVELLSNCLIKGYSVEEIPSHEIARQGGRMKSIAIIHGVKFIYRIVIEGVRYQMHLLRKRIL